MTSTIKDQDLSFKGFLDQVLVIMEGSNLGISIEGHQIRIVDDGPHMHKNLVLLIKTAIDYDVVLDARRPNYTFLEK